MGGVLAVELHGLPVTVHLRVTLLKHGVQMRNVVLLLLNFPLSLNQRLSEPLPALNGMLALLLLRLEVLSHAHAHIFSLCPIEGDLSFKLANQAISLALSACLQVLNLGCPIFFTLNISTLEARVVSFETVI